ncbi:MAG: hypothetical protein AAGE93_04460 [Bacteroidota bacterium]
MDGVSLTNPVSLIQPHVQRGKDQLVVSWKAIEKEGKVKIWLSSTNQFKDHGKSDAYKLIGETSLSDEQFTIDLTEPQSAFHKVVIEEPHNTVN